MKKSKHMKEEKSGYRIVILLMIITIIVLVLILCKNTRLINYINADDKYGREGIIEKKENTNIENEYATKNEKLVLKSNYEENRERKITYFFKENILDEINILEKYADEETYIKERDKASKRADIELIKIDDEQLEIYYKKLKLGSDEGLLYEQIYNKYMGIIGAYEIIE